MPDNAQQPSNSPLLRPIFLARLFFVLLATWMGALLGWDTQHDPRLFSALGLVGSLFFVLIEYSTNAIALRKIILAAFGWLVGLLIAQLFYPSFAWFASLIVRMIEAIRSTDFHKLTKSSANVDLINVETARLICHMLFGYLGLVLAIRHADWLRFGNMRFYLANPATRPKVLDSSVIIDGRILDVIKLGLFDGPVAIPQFVLAEVQFLADSAESHRRARGRRGLEVLDKLRTACPTLDILNTDFPDVAEVDQKLVRLCASINAELVSNDFNLQKIAQLHHVTTINLNELAAVLRPTVYIGETLVLKIVKTGKEAGQGVGYLEDGSMVVVDDAESRIGRDCEVVIVSLLQNPSGRLIFARPTDDGRR